MSNFKKRNFINILLFFLSIIFFCLEHPNFINENGFGFLGWISYIPILFLIRNISLKQSWMVGFLYGISSFSLFSYWMVNHSIAALGASLLLCGIEYSIFFFLLKYEDSKSLKYGWIFQFIISCCFEYLKTKSFLGNSYGLVGYSQWKYTEIIQITDIIGIYGFSFFVMFPSFFIYSFIRKLMDKKNIKTNRDTDNQLYECTTHINYISKYEIQLKSTSIILPVIFCLLWGAGIFFVVRYGKNSKNDFSNCKTKRIALIQHNPCDNHPEYETYKKDAIRLISLTDEAKEMSKDLNLIVWPETAVIPELAGQNVNNDNPMENQLSQNVLNYIISVDIPLVTGNSYSKYNDDEIIEHFNSALYFNNNQNNPDVYSKNHLVPMSEYIPFVSKFETINNFFRNNNMNMWTPGTDVNVFKLDDFYFSTPICFEDTFPDIPREMVQKGSRCFVNISNDSWAKSKVSQYQHLSMAVFRAVENKIPLVKCSSSGQSCFISSEGKIEKMAQPFISTYIYHDVPVLGAQYKQTFFTRYGDIAGFSAFIFGIVLLIIQIFVGIIKCIKNKSQVEKNG